MSLVVLDLAIFKKSIMLMDRCRLLFRNRSLYNDGCIAKCPKPNLEM